MNDVAATIARFMGRKPVSRRLAKDWQVFPISPPRSAETPLRVAMCAAMNAADTLGRRPLAWMLDGAGVWVR